MENSSNPLSYCGSELSQNDLFDKEQSSLFPNQPKSMSNETSTRSKHRESSVYNLGVMSSEINASSMEQSNFGIYYPESFSNQSISQYVQQSNMPLNCPGSILNESFTHFMQHQNSVYNPITSDQSFSYGMKPSNSYLNYPGPQYRKNNSNCMQQSSLFLHAPDLKPSESISRDMQLSSIPHNYTGSISNELVTYFP
ncbi:hypothetical protein NPIL_237351 [Nephila pilipes]|uniref:Uncharacterized protein n=1 Tax=Nephila pilipes TaxID=299642 RepID=A0A8X6PND4_NEPPI|nr:hypothetical protein NPIL_237351 [Nephila pilipes]